MSDLDLNIRLSDGGTIKGVNKDNDKLNDSLSLTDRLMTKINKAKAAAYRATATPDPEGEGTGYGKARATVGTGAAGRDFAKQAQGLGGLVHVYATFAANLFAVGAAFRALSDAADTTNMIKGLDQLGANSGKNLGTLSQRLVESTDGAISLREAMTAVAQSSAAGMTSNNILKMGTAAKQASQVLGISMGDAIGRLSRGITKLEPELLDELGLFTKLDTATADYARTVGKSASTLTDFERRQAFANAVLKEADEKFGKIKSEANPYDKLLASVKNLSQSGLELVNKVLGPIVDFLSKSPLALSGVMAGIATMLIKQAIPAIGQYRQAMQAAADDALVLVAGKSKQAAVALAAKKKAAVAEAETLAQTFVDARDQATAKFESMKEGKLAKSRSKVGTILDKSIYEVEQKDIDYLYKQANKNITTNQALAQSYKDIADTIVAGQSAEKNYHKTKADAANAEIELAKRSQQTLKEDVEFKNRSQSALTKIIAANASANVSEIGYVASLKKGWGELMEARKKGGIIEVPISGQYEKDSKGKFLRDEDGKRIQKTSKVAVEALGNMGTAAGAANLAISATATKLGSLASKAGTIGIAIGIAMGIFQVFNAMLSDSEKESAALEKSFGVLGGSIDNIGRTLDAVRAKDPDRILSVESIQARANAFNELQDSLATTTKAFEDFGKKQNWWDRSIEGTQRFFSAVTFGFSEKLIGAGPRKEMSDKLSESIIAAIRTSESGPARDKITKELSNLVGFDASTLDQKGLKESLDKLDLGDLATKSKDVAKAITKFSNDANNSASKLTAFQDGVKQTAKDIDQLSASLAFTDNMGKIGTDLVNLGAKMSSVLEDPIKSFVALKEVVDNTQLMSILPQDLSSRLINTKIYIDDLNKSVGETTENAQKAREALAKMKKDKEEPSVIRKQAEAVKTAEFLQSESESRAKGVAKQFAYEVSNAIFGEGLAKLDAAMKKAIEEGAIAAQRGYLSALAGAGGATAGAEADLRMREVEIQKTLINAQYEAKLAQENNTLAIEQLTISNNLRMERDKLAAAKDDKTRLDASAKITELEKNQSILAEKKLLLGSKNLKGDVQGIMGEKLEPGAAIDPRRAAAIQLSPLVSTLFGRDAQISKLEGQKEAIAAEKVLRVNKEIADQKNKDLDTQIASNNNDLAKISLQEKLLGQYDSNIAAKKQELEISNAEKMGMKEKNNIQANIDTLVQLEGKFKKGTESETNRITALERARKDLVEATGKAEANVAAIKVKGLLDAIQQEEALLKKTRDDLLAKRGFEDEIAKARLTRDETEMARKMSLGLLDDKGIADERMRIDLANQKIAYETQLVTVTNAELDLIKQKRDLEAAIDLKDTQGYKDKEAQYNRDVDRVATQRRSIEALNDAKVNGIRVANEMSSSFTGFSKIVEGAFVKMGDAIVNFVTTGKLNFKDLINTMLADLIRFEMQAQMRSAYAAMGGLSGMLFSMGIGGTDMAVRAASAGSGNSMDNLMNLTGGFGTVPKQAKGGAYDAGIKAFAQGGAFTNQLVTSPTLFKFAHGTGLMGEAGPEAIMPLKRDANGNLGVRSGNQGNTSVVVNNYGSEKATTKESVDSRGNRKIEVIIGDIVAGELNRPGSTTQQAMTANYGASPMVARR